MECFRWSLGDLDPARGRPGNAASLTAPGAAWIPNTNGSPQDRVLTLIAGGSVTEVPTLGEWELPRWLRRWRERGVVEGAAGRGAGVTSRCWRNPPGK